MSTIFFTGGNNSDTRGKIDDTQTVLKDYKTWKISRVEILASNAYIGALHIHYKVPGLDDEISSGSHIGSAVLRENPYTWSELVLEDDEYIIEISGRSKRRNLIQVVCRGGVPFLSYIFCNERSCASDRVSHCRDSKEPCLDRQWKSHDVSMENRGRRLHK
jgi:hypothetical protein